MKLILGLLLAGCAFGQVTFTRPVVRGTTVPMSCTITGQLFVDTDGTEGENLYICDGAAFDAYTGTGGGGGGATSLTGLTDLKVTVSGAVATVATGRVNIVVAGVPTTTSVATGTITKNSGTDTGTFYIYVTSGGALSCLRGAGITIGNYTVSSGLAGSTCPSGSAFPADSIPLATVDVSSGTLQTPVEQRALFSRDPTAAGSGLTKSGNTYAVDTTVVPLNTSLNTKFVVHDTGGDDSYAGNPVGGAGYCPSALADGLTVDLVVDTTNTGAATLDFCGLGALEITTATAGTDLTNGDLIIKKLYHLVWYDASPDLWLVTLPGAGGGGGTGGVQRVAYSSLPTCDSSVDNTQFIFTDGVGLSANCDGSSYAYFYNGSPATLPGVVSGWTGVNLGTSTATDSAGAIFFKSEVRAGDTLAAELKSLGGATTVEGRFLFLSPGVNYHSCGLLLADGTATTSDAVFFGQQHNNSFVVIAAHYAAIDGAQGGPVYSGTDPRNPYFRIEITGGNHVFYLSQDGQNWNQVKSEAASITATHYGFGCNNRSSTDAAAMSVVHMRAF